jgi:hypothetical protein
VHTAGGPVNPNLAVLKADASTFEAVDRNDNRFFIKGTLTGGVLSFTVVAELTGGQRGAVSGKDFFAAMMANYLPRITTIVGHWITGVDLDTNIRQFNTLTDPAGGSLPDPDAAKQTWTGRRATDYQFARVAVIFKDPPDAPGSYTEVVAHFTK